MDNTDSYTDSRGTIKDLLVTDEYSITHITFENGAVRGNHYHNETTQKDVILTGSLLCSLDGKEQEVSTGDYIQIEPKVKHAYKALEYSEILSVCWGVRKGADYEKDVVRLNDNEKLL
jgi:quercetin dioxygenase-like cupin family protein